MDTYSRQMETYGIQMNTIRRNTWIHMGDRLKYMGTDGNIEAQRKQETMQKAINIH